MWNIQTFTTKLTCLEHLPANREEISSKYSVELTLYSVPTIENAVPQVKQHAIITIVSPVQDGHFFFSGVNRCYSTTVYSMSLCCI